ncbi:MAG: cysteine--tRNA ligase [Candidatus Aenigmarchaeota archaeon]|nr:cysteine--tRNA ligase [Candidatus Aenigmarchaeota archaeon]
MKIFNTLSREKEELNKKEIKMFVCGPTVYDNSHLGHARTYIAYDIIAKYLRYRKYGLFFLMNITDVDDKIINRAAETKKDPKEIAIQFEKAFMEDLKTLGIDSIDKFARPSEHIKEIIDQIQRLLKKKFAYETKTGVYFDITKFADYGRLSHQNTEELKKHRIEPDHTKKHPHDFSLWKKREKTEMGWDSPFGFGRPGWHIEDTAISEKYLGQQYEIHGGAIDLVFPHHEAEIAQMESVSGKKPMVRLWTHTGFLLVNGEKMAKSLGNFVTIKEALKKHGKEVLRLFFSMSHYRSPIDFDENNLKRTKNTLDTIYNSLVVLESIDKGKDPETEIDSEVERIKSAFIEHMDDDFNTPYALSSLFELVDLINKYASTGKKISHGSKGLIETTLLEICAIFGILQDYAPVKITGEIKKLVAEREAARTKKDYKKADALRSKLEKMGITIEDTNAGVILKKKS